MEPSGVRNLIVGYFMKASREGQLQKIGLLQREPIDGMTFKLLDLDQPLAQQEPFHILLHKASDELVYDARGVPQFSQRIVGLRDYLAHNPQVCVVEPLEHTCKVIDRIQLSSCLKSMEQLDVGKALRVRAPKFVTVQSFAAGAQAGVEDQLQLAGMAPPYIAKPVAACGLQDSHHMALVMHNACLAGLDLPVPAILQEFVNHGGAQHKVYVMGSHVYYTSRASIPDVFVPESRQASSSSSGGGGSNPSVSGVHYFDSLQSLPTSLPQQFTDQDAPLDSPSVSGQLDMQVLNKVAQYLRRQLGLRLIGFDIVVCSKSGDYVIVDVNYFPNYRDAPGDLPALFRQELRSAYLDSLSRSESGDLGELHGT